MFEPAGGSTHVQRTPPGVSRRVTLVARANASPRYSSMPDAKSSRYSKGLKGLAPVPSRLCTILFEFTRTVCSCSAESPSLPPIPRANER